MSKRVEPGSPISNPNPSKISKLSDQATRGRGSGRGGRGRGGRGRGGSNASTRGLIPNDSHDAPGPSDAAQDNGKSPVNRQTLADPILDTARTKGRKRVNRIESPPDSDQEVEEADKDDDTTVADDDSDVEDVDQPKKSSKVKGKRPMKRRAAPRKVTAVRQRFKLPAFGDLETLVDAFYNKNAQLLALSISKSRARAEASRAQEAKVKACIEYLARRKATIDDFTSDNEREKFATEMASRALTARREVEVVLQKLKREIAQLKLDLKNRDRELERVNKQHEELQRQSKVSAAVDAMQAMRNTGDSLRRTSN